MANHRQLSERVLKLKNALAQGKSLDAPMKKPAHICFADEWWNALLLLGKFFFDSIFFKLTYESRLIA